MKKKVIIMGAAGRDFHNFNVYFKENEEYEVVAFTAEQIPGISEREYPPELSGKLYPNGIPIYEEKQLSELIKKYNVNTVILAYSDLAHEIVMQKASTVLAAGANFELLGPNATMLKALKPVVAVCAVRTGCGKSQVSRHLAKILKEQGNKVVIVRHPMPYGDLKSQIWERFETYADLDKYHCTIEEREDYEPHIDEGNIVFAGVDYKKILDKAEKEAQIIIWDGGNNDMPFYKPNILIVITDPFRAGHELSYYPGETNLKMANVVIINKANSARKEDIEKVRASIRKVNPNATIIKTNSKISSPDEKIIMGKILKAIVIDDGPTLTHGGLPFGAGYAYAKNKPNIDIIDPRPYAVGSIKEAFAKFPHLKEAIPAVGYSPQQIKELEETINKAQCDVVISGTPIDLSRILKANKPLVRVKYKLEEIDGEKPLKDIFPK